MAGSLKIARVFGVSIYVHWTFLLLMAWTVLTYLAAGHGLVGALFGVGFVAAIFSCIVLHELGHALMAKRFGAQAQDITLLPIGGVARFQRMPERPLEEFLVALAGPAVNIVIAAALLAFLWPLVGWVGLAMGPPSSGKFLQNLMWRLA